jgi:RsmE family RNA methyltransferase
MQSRRVWLPEVAGVRTLSELDGPWAMAVPGGPPVGRSCDAVVVGPEGGWTDAELGAGFTAVGLGPHVMRTETASIAAGALLAAARWAVG